MVLTMIETTVTNLRYPIAYGSLVLLIYLSVQDPWTILRLLLPIGLVSLSYTFYFLHSERSSEFLYGWFCFFSLFWIFPYAPATVRNQSWLTC